MNNNSESLGLARDRNRQGIQLAQQGRLEESATAFREALCLCPEFFEALCNLGNVLTFQGRLQEARTCYEQALVHKPQDAVLLSNLSNLLRQLGQLDEAVARAREAVVLRPDHAEAFNNLGSALLMLQKREEAVRCFQQALALQPNLVAAASNLGEALRQLYRPEEAIACLRQALALQPHFPAAHSHLGAALIELGHLEEAEVCLRTALRLDPAQADAPGHLAHTLWRQGRFTEAEICCREDLARRPDRPAGYNILGVVLARLGRLDEALASYGTPCNYSRITPTPTSTGVFSFSCRATWPAAGRSTPGWRCSGLHLPSLPEPAWDGSLLAGRTILLHPEQGLGDTLQFVRYAPLLQERGGHVVLAAPPALAPLLRRCPGLDQVVPANAPLPSGIDVHASLLDLPRLLGTTLDTVPAQVPYIFPDDDLVALWGQQLAGLTGYRVGIVWRGSAQHPEDRLRSIPLAQFEPLARVPGVTLLSLQVGPGSEQLSGLEERFPVIDVGIRFNQTPGALEDVAAVLRHLDLVIGCDTALVHLAGAMGVPVWLALSYAPDWRWLLERTDTPWYPTMRLFRQEQPGDWTAVFARMAEGLGRQ